MLAAKLPILSTLAALALPMSAAAQDVARSSSEPHLSGGASFDERTGEDLFVNVCRACHMPDGGGASGAGTYPSLIKDTNLEAGGYPVYVVVNGQRAMPGLGKMLSDDQVAAVVNYARTHFGNNYRDAVTAADAKAARQ